METALIWIAGVAALGIAIAVIALVRPDSAALNFRNSCLGLLVGGGGLALTLPERPPWHADQGLGWGFALGAVGAVLAMNAAAARRDAADSARSALAAAGAMAAGVAAVAVVLVTLWQTRIDAIIGLMLGWITTAQVPGFSRSDGVSRPAADAFAIATLFVGFLAVACALSAYRGATPVQARVWAASSLVTGASVCVATLVAAAILRVRTDGSLVVSCASAALIVGLSSWAVSMRIAPLVSATQFPEGVFWCALLGLAAATVIASLASAGHPPSVCVPLSALVSAGAALPAFQLLAGLGLAITGLAAIALLGIVVSVARSTRDGSADTRDGLVEPMALLLAIAASRVAIERYSSLTRPFTLSDHYAIVMLLFGVFIPVVLARWAAASASLRRPMVALGSVLWPVVMVATWGPKSVYPALIGLGLAGLWARSDENGNGRSSAWLIGLAGIFSLLQFTDFGAAYSTLTRLDRAKLIALIGGACIVLLAVSEFVRTRRLRRA